MTFFEMLTTRLGDTFLFSYLLSPVYVAATVALVWFVWWKRGIGGSFLAYLFPKNVYLHRSTWMDIKLAAFNVCMMVAGFFSMIAFTPWVTIEAHVALVQFTGHSADGTSTVRMIFAGLLIFVTQDFCQYWTHYLNHKYRFLWPFHAVHHSAEVMTPITFMRAHPVYYIVQLMIHSVIVGIVQALVLFAVIGQITTEVVYVSVIAWNVYVFFGAHLRHSHVWISYGRFWEHILISPAQHQIHHSTNPEHFDKNYGEIFAIWDWLFGTLYVPEKIEDVTFGLGDQDGVLIPQKYPTLRTALLGPFQEVLEDVAHGTSYDPNRAQNTQS